MNSQALMQKQKDKTYGKFSDGTSQGSKQTAN
jgi:hypothetical protein